MKKKTKEISVTEKEQKCNIRGRLADGTPNPIDLHVGQRLKDARIAHRISQERLAEELGITFQQVQKYEKGLNRIGASRLWDLAQVLGEPIEYFYQDIDEITQNQSPRRLHVLRETPSFSLDTLEDIDFELLHYFKNIRDPKTVKAILELVRALSYNDMLSSGYRHLPPFPNNNISDFLEDSPTNTVFQGPKITLENIQEQAEKISKKTKE